jgi:hypothetical protein
MNTTLKNNESWLAKCKRIFIEQLWLIFLLAPLLIVAFLITEHYQPAKQKIMLSKHTASLKLSVEITSAELAMIVAKPIGELLAMDVYLDYKQAASANLQVTSNEDSGNVENEAYNKMVLNSDVVHLYAKK